MSDWRELLKDCLRCADYRNRGGMSRRDARWVNDLNRERWGHDDGWSPSERQLVYLRSIWETVLG